MPVQQAATQLREWASIDPSRAAMTDGSSLCALVNHSSTLSTTLTPKAAQEILRDPDSLGLFPALILLERWIVVDELFVDLLAIASSHPGRDLLREAWMDRARNLSELDRFIEDPGDRWHALLAQSLQSRFFKDMDAANSGWLRELRRIGDALALSFTQVPLDVFRRCLSCAMRGGRALRDARPQVEWGTFGFGDYKDYGESLNAYYGGAANLARSHIGVERTLVYYELAAATGVPLVLHPARFHEAVEIERASCDAFNAVRELVRRSFEKPVFDELRSLGLRTDIKYPALAAKLVRDAGERKATILETAQTLKDSSEARSFRRWLAHLQEFLCDRTPGAQAQALRTLREIKNLASEWRSGLDVGRGVRYQRRKLHLAWIPRVGGLLELLDSRDLKDPILNRKGYLMFLASWYERA